MRPTRPLVALLTAFLFFSCGTRSGVDGAQGPQGDPGPAGATGAIGPQGPIGLQGPQGPEGQVLILDGGVVTGPRGAQGSSVLVVAIAPGATCATGGARVMLEDGGNPQTICNGVAGVAGRSVDVAQLDGGACPAGGVRITAADGGVTNLCNGLVGPSGAAGAQGVVGATGPQGQMGAPGATGPQGATGAAGAQGSAGAVGAQGPAGPAGAAGTQGPTGPAGAQGPAGATGAAGPAGSSGAQGPAGPALYLDGGVLPVQSNDGYSFAGFTAATYTGALGGPVGAHAKCAAEFPGAHLCTVREYQWSGSPVAVPAAGAFIDYSSYSSSSSPAIFPRDRYGGYSCNEWRSSDGPSNYAVYLDTAGLITSAGYGVCNVSRSLACCRSPQSGWFRGFTSVAYTGNLGGPVGAHAKCNAEFGGSHLCTVREYQWAGSPISVPGTGAFIDYSAYPSSSSPNVLPRDRYGGYSCNEWRSSDGPSNYAVYLDPNALVTSAGYYVCNVARPLSCCGG